MPVIANPHPTMFQYSVDSLGVQSNLCKWIPLKWTTRLDGYHLPRPVYTQCKVYNMDNWILCLSGLDTHNQVPVLDTYAGLTVTMFFCYVQCPFSL